MKRNEISESKAFEDISERANKLATKLKAAGWETSSDNPENEMILEKKCSSCGKEIIEHLTITAPEVEKEIDKIIEDSKKSLECLDCEMKEEKQQEK